MVPFGATLGDLPNMVALDLEHGGRLAAEHLLEWGHRRIGLLGASGGGAEARPGAKEFGFATALREAGAFNPDHFIVRDDSPHRLAPHHLAAQAAERWTQQATHQRPTAFACSNDFFAIHFIHALQNPGVRVPDDLSVVGFDNIIDAAYIHPPLTTLDGALEKQVQFSVQTLLESIENPAARRDPIVIQPTLVARQSVRRCDEPG